MRPLHGFIGNPGPRRDALDQAYAPASKSLLYAIFHFSVTLSNCCLFALGISD